MLAVVRVAVLGWGRGGLGVARRERNGRINYGRGNDRVNSGHLGGERWGFGAKATATFWAVPNGEARLRVCRGGSDLGASEGIQVLSNLVMHSFCFFYNVFYESFLSLSSNFKIPILDIPG